MGLFGFKRAGDKKKKANTPEPQQQPASKIDQNQLGEGQFFGKHAQAGSSSRPGTSHKLQKARPGKAAAAGISGGLDSSSNLNLPSQPWAGDSERGRSRTGSLSSAMPTNDASFAAMFNARNTSPSRPSTSHGNKPWVSPLDVHFKSNSRTANSSRPGTPGSTSSRPGTPGPGGGGGAGGAGGARGTSSKKAPPRLSELDLMRLVNQSQQLEQRLAARETNSGGSSRNSSKPSSPMTANFSSRGVGGGPRSPGLRTSLSTPALSHHKTGRVSPLSPNAEQAAQAYAKATGTAMGMATTTTTSADTTDVDTEDNQTQSTDNTDGTRATSPSLGEDDLQNGGGQSLNGAVSSSTDKKAQDRARQKDSAANGSGRRSWSAQVENADQPYPLQNQPHSGQPRQRLQQQQAYNGKGNPRSPTSPFPRDGDYDRYDDRRPGTAHGPRSGGPPRNNGPRDPREPRDARDARDYGRDPRDPRAQRDPRDPRYQRDGRDPRGRDPRADPRYRDNRDPRDPRYQRDPRDVGDPRAPKDPRDARDPRARDARSKSRPRNPRDQRQRDPRDYRGGDGYQDGYRDPYRDQYRDQRGYQQQLQQQPRGQYGGGYPPQGPPPPMLPPPPSRGGQRPYSPGPGQGPALKHAKSRDRMRPPPPTQQGQRPPMPRGPPGGEYGPGPLSPRGPPPADYGYGPQSPRGPPPADYGYGPQSPRDPYARDPYYTAAAAAAAAATATSSPVDESPTFPPEQQLSDAGYRPFSPSSDRRQPSKPRQYPGQQPAGPITLTQNRSRDALAAASQKSGHPLQKSISLPRAESPPPLAPAQQQQLQQQQQEEVVDYAAMATPPLSSPSSTEMDGRFRRMPATNLPLSPVSPVSPVADSSTKKQQLMTTQPTPTSSSRDTSEEPPLARYLAEEEEEDKEEQEEEGAGQKLDDSSRLPAAGESVVVTASTLQKNHRNYKDLTLAPQASSQSYSSPFSKPLGQSLPSPTSNWPLPSFGSAGLGGSGSTSGPTTADEVSPMSSQMATPVAAQSGLDDTEDLELTPGAGWNDFKQSKRQQSTIPAPQAFTASVYALEIGAGPYAADRMTTMTTTTTTTTGMAEDDDDELVPPSFPNFNHGGSSGSSSRSNRTEPRTVPQLYDTTSDILAANSSDDAVDAKTSGPLVDNDIAIGAAVTTDPSPPVSVSASAVSAVSGPASTADLESIGVARGLSIYDNHKPGRMDAAKRNHRGGGIYAAPGVVMEEEPLYQGAQEPPSVKDLDIHPYAVHKMDPYQTGEDYLGMEKDLAVPDVTELGVPVIREVADMEAGHSRFGRHTPTGIVDKFGTGFI